MGSRPIREQDACLLGQEGCEHDDWSLALRPAPKKQRDCNQVWICVLYVFQGVFSNPGLYCTLVQPKVKQLFYCGCEWHTHRGDNKSKSCLKHKEKDHESGGGQKTGLLRASEDSVRTAHRYFLHRHTNFKMSKRMLGLRNQSPLWKSPWLASILCSYFNVSPALLKQPRSTCIESATYATDSLWLTVNHTCKQRDTVALMESNRPRQCNPATVTALTPRFQSNVCSCCWWVLWTDVRLFLINNCSACKISERNVHDNIPKSRVASLNSCWPTAKNLVTLYLFSI